MALQEAIEHAAKVTVAYDKQVGEFPGPAFRFSMETLLWALDVRGKHAGHLLKTHYGLWKGCEEDVLGVTCLYCAVYIDRPREHDL